MASDPVDPVAAAAEHLKGLDAAQLNTALRRLQMMAAPEDAGSPDLKIVQSMGEFWDSDPPVPPTLVEPAILVRGMMTVTAGRAGKGKTQMNLNRIMRWTAGKPMFDTLPDILVPAENKPLRVVVIENEGSGGMFHKQSKLMYDNADFEGKELIRENMLVWGDGGYQGLKLDNPKHIEWIIRAAIEEHNPDVLFMEPFRQLWTGNENDSTEMARVLDIAEGLAAEHQIAVLIAHHEKKNVEEGADLMDRLRGSGAFEGTAGCIEHHSSVSQDRYRELAWSKNRYAPKPAPIRMVWNNDRFWYEHVADSAVAVAVLTVLTNAAEAMPVAEIADETGETQARVRKALEELSEDDKIKRTSAPGGKGSAWRVMTTTSEGLGV